MLTLVLTLSACEGYNVNITFTQNENGKENVSYRLNSSDKELLKELKVDNTKIETEADSLPNSSDLNSVSDNSSSTHNINLPLKLRNLKSILNNIKANQNHNKYEIESGSKSQNQDHNQHQDQCQDKCQDKCQDQSPILESRYYDHNNSFVPVLVYHHILHDEENHFGENSFIVSVENFKQQMKFLKDNNYITITLNQLENYIKGNTELPGKCVLITFDDGYKSNYVYAYPIMKEYSQHGVIFIVSGWIKNQPHTFNSEALQILEQSEIDSSRDIFEYASHTHNLHYLNEKNESALLASSYEIISVDLLKSKDLLKTTSIAYPYGKYSDKTIQIVKELGFSMGFTVNDGDVKPDDDIYQLKRHVIYRNTTLEQFKKIVDME